MHDFRDLFRKLVTTAALFSMIVVGLSGCLSESTGDAAHTEQDRQKQAAEMVQRQIEDAGFVGNYVGENVNYGRIEAVFRILKTTQNGSLAVPQPSIVGMFRFVKRSADESLKGAPDEALNSGSIPFKDGQYDPSTDTIVIQIAGDNPIEVNCTLESATDLHCIWSGSQGKHGYEEFDLKKVN